ncbi:hypothetical protein [uncultured Methanobrevibacter sp.]|uniref:hypothetical protein n=1 Tax=uncultured Methanobrevibacter sp. TaxID=253161 RepID=UPI0025E46424|nr:hypothetical protein [uncultured Methanobrevibacter sp.]
MNVGLDNMVGDTINSFNEYLSKVWECFDENIQGLITSDMSMDSQSSTDPYEVGANIDQTMEILHEFGFDWPKPYHDYLERILGYLDGLEFFS